ncbi:non-SMC mitotic condensation complex subunit 1 family protein [Cryptosporidium meleagridis]|uniref:Non-SMC mitotic condensation complex subunit 1 family protein n=1 Tax=Cryptosporidium meleagridis TaxID=93969 RepID=A0A2P4YX05_9CRYT|nr:non-SMC mitotic condensation complex subunit 1 family protein [Cryptosporidium meleagridis]
MEENIKFYQFIIPKKDSNLLKFLNDVEIIYKDDEAVLCIKNNKFSLDSNNDGVTFNSIINYLQEDSLEIFKFNLSNEKDHYYSETGIPLSLYYMLSISYLWSKITHIPEKKMFLGLILRNIEILDQFLINNAEKSHINNLFNMMVFCITNIVIQEFDILETLINEDKKKLENKYFNAKNTKNTKSKKRKNSKFNYEIDEDDDSFSESETEFDNNNSSDKNQVENADFEINYNIENIQSNKLLKDSSILEISFLLVKYLTKLSKNYININFSTIGLSEWSLILSLRIINLLKKLVAESEIEAFNNKSKIDLVKWENLSENLLKNILKSIIITNKCKETDEDENLNTCLFEIITNCFINGSIDLITNVNNDNNPNNRNSTIIKDFPAFISTITMQISEELSNSLFVYILENLGIYWIKMDKIEDIGEDDNIILYISSYVDSVSLNNPNTILNNISLIRRILKVMISYKLRSCFISSIANSFIEMKNKNSIESCYNLNKSQNIDDSNHSIDYTLENRSQIIEYIDLLLERIYDKHHNCRTRSIQSMQRLFVNDIIPYSFFINILKEVKMRTLDESSHTRSSSFNLLRTMIRKATENYYHLPLNHEQISSLLNNINNELSHFNKNTIDHLNNTIINSNKSNEETQTQELIDQNFSKKKESEYELMKLLLLDAKEVSLIVENILEQVCTNGIYSKINSDVSSCILFICESVSLNIKKGQTLLSNVLKCIWRVNNVNILNAVVHGFFVIMFNNVSHFSNPDNQENYIQNDVENEDQNLKLQFNEKILINQITVRNLLKVVELFNDDDMMNFSKLLEHLTSKNTQISKKYTQNFDLSLLKNYTINEISLIINNLSNLSIETEKNLKSLLELLLVIMKVESLNSNQMIQVSNQKDSNFEIIYQLFLDSASNKNYSIFNYSIECLNLIKINNQDYVDEILLTYITILSNFDYRLINNSLFINIINSVFNLIANPSNIKFLNVKENKSKVLYIDFFINKLFGHYHKRLINSKELSIVELSQITNLLSHIVLKYGIFVENLYNKWKYLHSISQKNSSEKTVILKEKNSECGIINLEEEYFEYIQMILENQLLSNDSIFHFIVPIINLLSRDPSLIADFSSITNGKSDLQWQLDYSRNCALISLCKLTSLTTKLLNINEKTTMNDISGQHFNINSKLSNLFEMPNIQLIFSFLYNPSSFNFISKGQMDDIMLNIILCTNDLLIRYPNIIDPWMEKQYSLLNLEDNNDNTEIHSLKYNIMLIINYLMNIGFIKPKDILLLSYLKCIDKKSESSSELSSLANSFFQEFFKDLNNQLVLNVVPLLINQLALEYSNNYSEKTRTQTIIHQTQYLLHFINNKDIACSGLIPKFFSRISLLNDPKAIELYVIALDSLKLGSKTRCISKIIENLNLITFHIQEFDFLKQFLAKIIQNHINSSQCDTNSEILSLLGGENLINSKTNSKHINEGINRLISDAENKPKN